MNLESFTVSVREFIIQRDPKLSEVDIREDTDLIDNRLIDSLTFVEFLLFLEDKFDRPVQVESGNLSAFRSITTIYQWLSTPREVSHV